MPHRAGKGVQTVSSNGAVNCQWGAAGGVVRKLSTQIPHPLAVAPYSWWSQEAVIPTRSSSGRLPGTGHFVPRLGCPFRVTGGI